MTSDELQELGYHLRELRADLALIRDDLQVADSADDPRAIRRAWIFAAALLEHDLEVHLLRAFELLGSALPPAPPYEGRRTGDAATPAVIAREARRLSESALAALPSEHDPPSSADSLIKTARAVHAAYQLARETVPDAVRNDEPAGSDEPRASCDGTRS
jgi:hypothetical protein